MPLLQDDPLTQIAFSVVENKGVFALLLGSGLSRAAHIPTGWEITLDLVRRVGLAQGVEEQADWAEWYREKAGGEPNYSTLLEELAASPEERRAILHRYIEPSEEDREEGRKVPTAAHHAIANMVASGHVRVIITTNFDRLMENALRERGIEPTIVSSVDALAGAEPLTHSACYLLKLHGDYKDARILNTESELAGYPAQYDTLLDRIFDEHGLIVSGWSGEWDHALRAAFLRAPNRRYSTFWTTRSAIGSGASQLVDHRRARVLSVTSADAFFTSLWQRIETLEQSQRQNPLSIELLINSTKRFLAKPEYRIQLDDLFASETERLIARLSSEEFAIPYQWDEVEFRGRVALYEAASEPLACMIGVLGRWGDGTEMSSVLDVVRTLYAQAQNRRDGGLTVYLDLLSYPAVLLVTAYALALSRAERWKHLRQFLHEQLRNQRRGEAARIVDTLFSNGWAGNEKNAWTKLEGFENRRTPLSDHLCDLFEQWGRRFLGLTPDMELAYERFEILAALGYIEQHEKQEIETALAGDARNGWIWIPIGRSSWHSSTLSTLLDELQNGAFRQQLTSAGFARGSIEYLDLFIQNYQRLAGRLRF